MSDDEAFSISLCRVYIMQHYVAGLELRCAFVGTVTLKT